MAKLNLSQAAKVTGKNRTTIWRHVNSGKLSAERDRDGFPFVDTSELIRAYGELKGVATGDSEKMSHQATPPYKDLIEVIELLRKEQAEMKAQIANLTNRLPYTAPQADVTKSQPIDAISVSSKAKPEDDPDWPKDIKTMADISLRNEIKSKY